MSEVSMCQAMVEEWPKNSLFHFDCTSRPQQFVYSTRARICQFVVWTKYIIWLGLLGLNWT